MANLSGVNKYFPVAKEGFATTTSAPVASGATTVQLSSVAGYSNGDTVVLVIDAGDVAKKQAFTGTVDTSGTQITNVIWTEGANTSHIIGAPVIDYVTASHQSMTTKGLLVSHDQDGTLKAGAVDVAGVLASNVVETAKIKDGAVTAEKLSTGAITLGYAQATTDFATSSGTLVDVTGLNVSVTIPSGGRRAKITFGCKFVKCDTPGYGNTIAILEGSTILQKYVWTTPASNHAINGFMVATTVPSAGVKTYKIQALSDAGATQTIVASSDAPSFILVELI